MRTHMCGDLRASDIGSEVSVCGWVGRRREHGEHLAFVDLRDHSGLLQCVIKLMPSMKMLALMGLCYM